MIRVHGCRQSESGSLQVMQRTVSAEHGVVVNASQSITYKAFVVMTFALSGGIAVKLRFEC